MTPAPLDTLWRTYHTQIYGYLYKIVRDHDVTADLTSTVFLRATVAYANGHAYDQNAAGWLYAIAKNVLIDHWRAMRRVHYATLEDMTELPAPDPPLDELHERAETAATVQRAIDALPPVQSAVAECYLCGYTYAEMALMLDKSTGAVKILQRRAELGLRQRLEDL